MVSSGRRRGRRSADVTVHVVIVDDEPTIGLLFALEAEATGRAEVRSFTTAKELDDEDYEWADVVIADLLLPGDCDGCCILGQARAANLDAITVLWTAVPDAMCVHADRVVGKPTPMSSMWEIIDAGT